MRLKPIMTCCLRRYPLHVLLYRTSGNHTYRAEEASGGCSPQSRRRLLEDGKDGRRGRGEGI